MANVDYRKFPEKPPKIPGNPLDPQLPDLPPHHLSQRKWDGGLIGVVYELTEEDYETVIRTEGGGMSYKDVLVACLPIPPTKISVPEKPPIPEIPRPFLAHTLYCPYIPVDKLPDDPEHRGWWYKLLLPQQRPVPDGAQASARYLKLIKDGAAEHDLPHEYQAWLHSLQPYTVTTTGQKNRKILLHRLYALLCLVN